MTPAELTRQSARLVHAAEQATLARIHQLLDVVQADGIRIASDLTNLPTTRGRVFRELRARQALASTRAARELLSLGDADGLIADTLRENTRRVYESAVSQARVAAVNSGLVTASEAALATTFAAGVDLDFLDALTRVTLTTLKRVGTEGREKLEEALVRGAVRGQGPRAGARLVRRSVDVTRHEAERITRTVYNRANNEARGRAFADSNLKVEYVVWDATNDERTCPFCASRHGMVWKRGEAPFPTVHPHCRCVLLPWNPDNPRRRGDAYYRATRAELDRRIGDDAVRPTTPGPFERSDNLTVPPPAWTPSGGWAHAS